MPWLVSCWKYPDNERLTPQGHTVPENRNMEKNEHA